ncbi:hypothetical protein NQ314_001134 [Rhamnusium bicolor]|uniref:Uncharacterized protein n=1 Tax=Rhamnusium bicolor TaxID=1586634 RepID=A0AAV8ZVU1_9CUCU|nr:hypothetical protein NQ314_001134 [Rhamnusium bicolor]
MNPKFFLLFLTLLVYCNAAPKYAEDLEYLNTVLNTVPDEEKWQFLIHQLYLGYILKHPDDLAINVPEEVTINLYEIFLRNYLINPVDKQVRSQLCFPSGECVETDDPGVYPYSMRRGD